MIYFFETHFGSWKHTLHNSSLISLVEDMDYKVTIVCSDNHYSYLLESGINNKIPHYNIPIFHIDYAYDEKEFESCCEELSSIFCALNINSDDTIISLSSHPGVQNGLVEVNRDFIARLIFVFHGELDYLLDENYNRLNYQNIINSIERTANVENVNFIAYNPYVFSALSPLFSNHVLDKFVYLDHPLFKKTELISASSRNHIGVYGACINANFTEILRRIYDCKRKETLDKFTVFQLCDKKTYDIRNKYPAEMAGRVIRSLDGNGIEDFINGCRWILLSYDKSMYQVSSSGILFDAVRYEVPIIALDSPIIKYYNDRYRIGIVCTSIEEIVDVIHNIDSYEDNYYDYVEGLRNMFEDTITGNKARLIELLKKTVSLETITGELSDDLWKNGGRMQ